MTEGTSPPATCAGTANHATGERCGSTDIAGFALHVVVRDVSGMLDGSRPYPELYLQPHCAEHMRRAEDSHRAMRDRGPSPLLVDLGFVGSAIGTVWIVRQSESS